MLRSLLQFMRGQLIVGYESSPPFEGTLTPAGAALLRRVRDDILADPQSFDWGGWDCCVAGHINRVTGFRLPDDYILVSRGDHAARALGFKCAGAPQLHNVFFGYADQNERTDVHRAAVAINRLLWLYGYPPDEVVAPVPLPAAQDAPMECVAET